MSVEYKDKGLELIMDKIAEFSKLALTLGFQGDEAAKLYVTGENVATVATFQELGTQDIPQRAFLRSTMFEQRDKIQDAFAKAANVMIDRASMTPIHAMGDVGAKLVKLIERKIANSRQWAKANAASTIAKKGFDFPLHETELMAKSVTWAVRDRSGHILATGGSNG